jgi:hypothetical protein
MTIRMSYRDRIRTNTAQDLADLLEDSCNGDDQVVAAKQHHSGIAR